MSQSLYNDAILAEAKAKHGYGELDHFTHEITTDNPLCGDRIKLQVVINDRKIHLLAHKTRGCLLTAAAMSIISRRAAGLGLADIHSMEAALTTMFDHGDTAGIWPELEMFLPVANVKSRQDCVKLPFLAMKQILS